MIGALIGAGVSVAGSLIGGAKADKEARKAQQALDQNHQSTMDALRRRANEDGLQTAASQSALTRAREMFNDNISRAQATQAVMGGTDASVAQAKAQANDALANAASNVAVSAENRRNQAEDAMLAENKNYANQTAAIHNQRAANNTQAANQAMAAGMGMATADMQSKLDTGTGLIESLWKKGGNTFDASELVNKANQLRINYEPGGLYGNLFK